MKRKTFDNYDYEEAFPVELDRDIQKKARKNFEKEHPLQVPDYEEQWKEQQEKLKEWELERLLKEGKVESLYRTTTTKAKNLQSGSELLEAQIYPSFCHKADVPHTKKGRESKPSQKNLNDKNSRRYFIRLANINFGENDLWCTFTWDKEHIPADEAAADRDIANFIRKINYRQKKAGRENIKYLIIPVVDGAEHPHVHIIMTGQGINRDELDKRGKIQHPPHKARQRLSSFGRCYIHDEQQEGEEKMERFKEPCKTERANQKLFKVQKKDR